MLRVLLVLALLVAFAGLSFATPTRYVSDNGVTTNNSTTMITKLEYTFETFNTYEDYLIQWTSEIHAGDTPDYIRVCLMFDGTPENDQNWHPDPNGGAGGWAVATGFVLLTPGAGNHTFQINFSSSIEGEEVSIRRARLLIEPCNVET